MRYILISNVKLINNTIDYNKINNFVIVSPRIVKRKARKEAEEAPLPRVPFYLRRYQWTVNKVPVRVVYRLFVRDKKRAGYVQRNALSRHRYESRKRYYERNIDCLPYGRFTIANKTRPTRVGGNWSAAAIEIASYR